MKAMVTGVAIEITVGTNALTSGNDAKVLGLFVFTADSAAHRTPPIRFS